MKVKNDLIRLNVGNKTYDFKNMILDEYLKRFAKFQMTTDNMNKISTTRKLRYCLLKFDTPFENLNEHSEIHNQEFDVALMGNTKYEQQLGKQQITISHQYKDFDLFYDYSTLTANEDPSKYYGKKITAIGFNSWFASDVNFANKFPVCAILDTSNYNIYFEKNQNFSITRRDIITTDAEFCSNNEGKVSGPAHLAPYGVPQIIHQDDIYEDASKTSWQSFYDSGYGILHSIGLSHNKPKIGEGFYTEYIVGTDIQLEIDGTDLLIKSIENRKVLDEDLYPNQNLYPGENTFPDRENYEYIIFKYKVWQTVHSGTYDNVVETETDTGLYYYMILPIEKYGDLQNIRIKYERS